MSDPIETAQAAWGDALPDWVAGLAAECAATSQNRVAAKLGRSAALISQVLRNKYPGDMEAVEELFNGAFRSVAVSCPALGTIPANECRLWRERARKFTGTNSLKVRMFRACNHCPRHRKGQPE